MRCFVASKLGDEVEIPEELIWVMREEREAEEINALMRSLSHDEIISRLRKGAW